MMNVELYIKGSDLLMPVVYDGIELSSQRIGEPSKLVFTCIKDKLLAFDEGASVRLTVNGKNMFYGFVFEKSRDKNNHIQVTCYDQLRYLKNKDTYIYTDKTASELISMIANDFNLRLGDIDNTEFKIAQRIEDNKTLFDIIYNALDITLISTGKLYVLYDDFGKLTLKNVENLKLDTVIDEETAENYDYKSSIDGDTYNQIKLVQQNKESGKRDVFIAKDSEHINHWGVLQYYEVIQEGMNGTFIANNLIDRKKGKNRKTRHLDISGAFGDVNVRAGVSIPISLDLGDIKTNNYLVVDSCTHKFNENYHTMDLHLIGGVGFV